VVLADQRYDTLFGAKSPAHYLNGTLVPQGTLLSDYHATAHGPLADGVALLAGQGPTPELQSGCPVYADVTPGTVDTTTGQAKGHGCVYPVKVTTLTDQLTANLYSWKAYIGGEGATPPPATAPPPPPASPPTVPPTIPPPTSTTTTTTPSTTTTTPTTTSTTTTTTTSSSTTASSSTSTSTGSTPGTSTSTTTTSTSTSTSTSSSAPNDPTGGLRAADTTTSTSCRHPATGAQDPTATAASTADGYVTRRNPFVYFQSIVDASTCATDDVGLDQLATDLQSGKVPTFSWVAPDLCSAGAAGACAPGAVATGPAAADAFLKTWIPKIEATAAYKKDGMIVIVSDEAPPSGQGADSSACCGKLDYPNSTNAGGAAKPGPGGGLTGALVISGNAAHGVVDPSAYDHFTLLRTIEDIFNLPYLGYATQRKDFGSTVFPSESGGSGAVTTSAHHPGLW
jgi:hypothetical protein